MNNNIELCWNITSLCNQSCRYCHRFLNVAQLDYQNNRIILKKLFDYGIKKITWTGGEALLLPYLDELLKESFSLGIRNKIITNGMLLTEKRIANIHKSVDVVTLSIDSTDSIINDKIGRGGNHFNTIKDRLNLLHKYNVKYNINTVLNKLNKDDIYNFSKFIHDINPTEWRVFKFLPLRETSLKTREIFDISQTEFDKIIDNLKKENPTVNIVTREIKDFEKLYLLILANGDVFVTKNGTDIKLGNLLIQNLDEILSGETS